MQTTDWCHVEAGQITAGPGPLPDVWRNISGLPLLEPEEIAALGWRPVSDIVAPLGPWQVQGAPILTVEPAAVVREWPAVNRTPDEIVAILTAAVQAHLDAQARARGYDDIRSAVTYAEEPAVPAFQAEGQAFRAWRSLVWGACYQILADVQSGARPVPESAAALIAELPALNLE